MASTTPRAARPTRRAVLGAGAAAAVWTQIGRLETAAAAETAPDGFPQGLDLYRRIFRNWDTTIVTERLWSTTARTPQDVLRLVRWAAGAGWRLRPQGHGHNWSPLVTSASGPDADRVVLVDTTSLARMSMDSPDRVRVQAGAAMLDLLRFLSDHGRSLVNTPAPGDVTVGGVLAIGGHGTALPARGETPAPGAVFGSLSNAVVELTAAVWDAQAGTYVLRTFSRTDPQIGPLLVSLGRTFVVEVVLQTVPNYRLRCRNTTSITTRELFAAPERAGSRSLASLVDRYGRVGLIWYALTDRPWVQTWQVCPRRPLLSRPTTGPFNYPFADRLDDEVAAAIAEVTQGARSATPLATHAMLAATAAGLAATGGLDMWGEARHFLHFVKPTTLKVSAASHAVVTRRADIQRVVHEFTTSYSRLVGAYRARGLYPANNVCEIRITGVDDPREIGMHGAQVASLSAAAPVPGRPDLDTVVWLDVLNLPGTPGSNAFFAELDAWFLSLRPELGVARPEWAKRFAHTEQGPWTAEHELHEWIPRQVPGWTRSLQVLDELDPKGIFRAELHDRLMPSPR